MGVAITTVSSRGQIVVPADLRQELNLSDGTKLLIYSKGGVLIVKKISENTIKKDFEEIVAPVRQKAKNANLKKQSVGKALSEYRSEKRKNEGNI